MAADINEIRKAMRAAQVTGSGDYITSGTHLLELTRAKFNRTMIQAKAKESMIFEFKVHTSSHPDKMPVGETRSYVDNPDNTGYLGRVKGCILALMGVDPNGKVSPNDDEAATEVYCALLDDSIRVGHQWPENFLAGNFVICEGFDGVSQTNHKPIVKKNWKPSPKPAPASA
jgi:hypothetical protein